jgi:hypothetical protein
MLGYYWAFVACSAIVIAYTMAFQKSTLFWGKRLASDDELLTSGFQDALTPKLQTIRNIFIFISFLASSVAGLILIRWYM